MPVLRDHDVLELAGELVDYGDDIGAAFDRERAAIDETILHVHHDQRRLAARPDWAAGRKGAQASQSEKLNKAESSGRLDQHPAMVFFHGESPGLIRNPIIGSPKLFESSIGLMT